MIVRLYSDLRMHLNICNIKIAIIADTYYRGNYIKNDFDTPSNLFMINILIDM